MWIAAFAGGINGTTVTAATVALLPLLLLLVLSLPMPLPLTLTLRRTLPVLLLLLLLLLLVLFLLLFLFLFMLLFLLLLLKLLPRLLLLLLLLLKLLLSELLSLLKDPVVLNRLGTLVPHCIWILVGLRLGLHSLVLLRLLRPNTQEQQQLNQLKAEDLHPKSKSEFLTAQPY